MGLQSLVGIFTEKAKNIRNALLIAAATVSPIPAQAAPRPEDAPDEPKPLPQTQNTPYTTKQALGIVAKTIIPRATPNEYTPPPIPDGWRTQQEAYVVDGQAQPRHVDLLLAPANTTEKGVVFFSLGWNSAPGSDKHQRFVSNLQENGYTVIIMPLIDPKERMAVGNAYDENLQRQKEMLFDKNAFVHRYAQERHLPVLVVTHSASGNMFKRNSENVPPEQTPEMILSIHSATFIAPSNASPIHPIKQHLLFNVYTPLHRNLTTAQTLCGRFYQFVTGEIKQLIEGHPDAFPQYRDIRDMTKKSMPYYHEDRRKPPHLPPEIYIISANDNSSCPITTERAARGWLANEPDAEKRILIIKGSKAPHYPHLEEQATSFLMSAIVTQTQAWHEQNPKHKPHALTPI